jgi:sortase A
VKKYRARRFRRYERRKRRRSRMVSVISVLIVVAGLGLLGYAFLGGDSSLLKAFSSAETEEELTADPVARSKTMKLTVPEMSRVQDLNVYSTPWDDETALEAGAQHVEGTGFPWEDEPNVYIAGHRIGFPGTDSYLVFYDLDVLEEGDEVFLTDSEGSRYTYEVFDSFETDPYDWSVTEPVSGKNIVTLQTCTLPDYSDRIIVQAELTEVESSAEEAESLPEEPETVEQTPIEPVPDEQYAIEQYPIEPIVPNEQYPTEPLPAEPLPVEPAPVEPLPAGPAVEPQPLPVEPVPTGPAPVAGPAPF